MLGSLPYKILNCLLGYAGAKHDDTQLLSAFYVMAAIQCAYWLVALLLFISTWTDGPAPAQGTAEYDACVAEDDCDIDEWTKEMGADGSANDVHWIGKEID